MDPNLDWNAYFLLWNPQTGFINRFISFHKLAKKKFCTIADITQVKVNCTWNTYHGDYPPQIKITRLNPFHEELNEIIDFKSVQSIKKWLDWQIHFSQIHTFNTWIVPYWWQTGHKTRVQWIWIFYFDHNYGHKIWLHFKLVWKNVRR